jgi:hypothetical protein
MILVVALQKTLHATPQLSLILLHKEEKCVLLLDLD